MFRRVFVRKLLLPYLLLIGGTTAIVAWHGSQGLGLLVLAAMLLMSLLAFWVVRRQLRPISELTHFADALARGDLNRRLLSPLEGQAGTLGQSLNLMADSLSRLVAQTRQDTAELQTILASMNEGVIATDREQRILLVNQAAARLLGFGAEGAAGRRLWEVVRLAPVLQAASDVLATRDSRTFAIGPLAGRHVEVTVCTFPERAPAEPDEQKPDGAAGPVSGLVLVAHDTTQSVQYQELRKEFVANVSHELRTPLTIIRGFSETLRDGAMDDPAKKEQYLRIIEKHADQLTNLVNDLLELSRLESQPGTARRTTVDLGAVVRRVRELLMPAAEKKHQTLAAEVTPQLPMVVGDPDYLERAIGNLVDNAVKYTPEGGRIAVTVSMERMPNPAGDVRSENAEGEVVVVEVCDNGIGIPADDLPRIFERFYRVDRSRSRDMGGTGLGLSIVKHVVQSHGGRIDVRSEPGGGSTFTLRFAAPPGLSRAQAT